MSFEEKQEFIAMLLIERRCNEEVFFYDHFIKVADKNTFNKRYKELLDKFLNQYALNNPEKSDETS